MHGLFWRSERIFPWRVRRCAGTPDSEPIRKPWRMLSSGPRPVVVSTTTGASSRPLGLAAWALWRRRWPEAAVVARPCWNDSSGQ